MECVISLMAAIWFLSMANIYLILIIIGFCLIAPVETVFIVLFSIEDKMNYHIILSISLSAIICPWLNFGLPPRCR